MAQDQKTRTISWHTAFYDAIRLELEDYAQVLEFKFEHQLTAEPLRIDTLIIKKSKGVTIGKNFAQMFRAENICEYKSPDDYLSVKDFYKVYAYACLYAAITAEVDISDITLTFIGTRYPRELLKHLQEVRHYRVEEPWPGIYRVLGDFLPIQILESRKLSESDNIWLRGLNPGLDLKSANVILEKSEQKGKDAPIWAYLEVFLRTNSLVTEEVYKMARKYPTLEEALEQIGILPRMIERAEKRLEQGYIVKTMEKDRESARKMKADRLPLEKIQEYTGLPSEEIEKL
ncbi:hypothetical protein AGMMS49587_17600 [Spirochaetia bacterium]|nr:hypothetical protein AGMMS49587_17600 [Spirochaetia bacterium]